MASGYKRQPGVQRSVPSVIGAKQQQPFIRLRRSSTDYQGNMHNLDYKTLIISVCILHFFTFCEGRPLRKRTVSEVQLMHNLRELKQVQERRQWLQMRLQGLHTAPAWGSSREAGRTRRRPLPDELPDLSNMTPEEIQQALNLLEKLLKSKHT